MASESAAAPRLTLDRAAGFAWRSLVVAAAVSVAVWGLVRLRVVVVPVVVAVIVSSVVKPAVDALERRRVPRAAGALLIVVGSLAVLGGVIALLAPSVGDQFADLGPTLEEGREEVEDWLVEGPLELSRREIDRYVEQAGEQLSSGGSGLASEVAAGAVVVGEVITGILLTLVLLFFFAKDGDRIAEWFLGLVPGRHHPLARAVGGRAWAAMHGYLRGTAIVAFVDAAIIGIGLAIIGVPLVLPLAILTFLAAFFPLVGAVVAGVVAVLVALVSGGVGDALLAAAVVLVVQQVEGDVLAPVVLGRAVRLHAIVILLVLTAGATLGGLIGALLAVPLAAVASAVGNELRLHGIAGTQPASSPGA